VVTNRRRIVTRRGHERDDPRLPYRDAGAGGERVMFRSNQNGRAECWGPAAGQEGIYDRGLAAFPDRGIHHFRDSDRSQRN